MKTNLVTCGTLLSVLALMASCGNQTKTTSTQEDTPKVLVRTVPTIEEEVEQIAEFTGSIEPYKQNNITPSLAVRIDQILVEVGDNVQKGQLLVRMDPTQYNQAAVQLANLETDYQRLKAVYDAGGISKQQLDQSETQLEVQRDNVKNLKDNIELRSPVTGVVTGRYYDPGDMFSMTPNESGAASILQVMQIDKLKVTMTISEQYFPQVKVGMPVDITLDLFPDRTFQGKVTLVYPSIDPQTRTFQVEVTIPNGDRTLRPGMYSRATLKFGSKPGVMVKDLAVQKQIGSNEKYVFVIKDGKAERRTITTGRQIGDEINVLTGLEAGEEVVVAGIAKLIDGTEVEVKND